VAITSDSLVSMGRGGGGADIVREQCRGGQQWVQRICYRPSVVCDVINVVAEFMVSAAADLLQAFSVTSSIMVTELMVSAAANLLQAFRV
jgi:hypothetical protein